MYIKNRKLRGRQECIAIVRTNWYNIARKGNTKIFERSVTLWQQNQLICTQE